MRSKILPILFPVIILASCSTAYRSGQTPDDVYYSPARENRGETERDEERRQDLRRSNAVDYEIAMGIRDRRWRDFREDYEYNNSPYYKYCVCRCTSTGYYYNPYYYPWAIYPTYSYASNVNTTPRMVNLNTYQGYNTKVASGKTNGTISWAGGRTYNNSNRSTSPSQAREVLVPSRSSEPSSNNTRTYNPSSSSSRSSSSGSSGSSSSGSSSSGSVSRPNRGG